MSFARRLFSAPRRSRSPRPARRRRSADIASSLQGLMLEERLLLSRQHAPLPGLGGSTLVTTVYVAPTKAGDPLSGPFTLQHPVANPGDVIFLGGVAGSNTNTPGMNWGTVPTKAVTFTNNSNTHQTIYPFLYSPNNDKKYDPIDVTNDEYRLYIGYEQDGKFILGLPYGKSITIDVPLVFWNGGRADIATDGRNLLPAADQVNTLNPYQFRYTASTTVTAQGVLSSNDNGVLMYYKANTPNAPNDPSPASAGQLTEWTIRDQDFLTKVNDYDQTLKLSIPASELVTLVNYDVSYVDDLTAPIAMSALNVPVPIQYIQNGTAATQGNTTTIQLDTGPNGHGADALINLLTKLYPYNAKTPYQWQVKFNTGSTTAPVELGTVTGFDPSTDTVTVVSSGPVSGLLPGLQTYVFYTNSVVQDFGWTGANNDIKQMQDGIKAFTSNDPAQNGLGQYFGGLGWPQYYNPDPNSLIKIPSGASILINSPLGTNTSPYDVTHYLLTSGNGGNQIFYQSGEVLQLAPGQPVPTTLPQGSTVTFKVTITRQTSPGHSEDITRQALTAIKSEKDMSWILTNSFNTAGFANPVGTINVKDIDPAAGTVSVTLAQTLKYLPSGWSFPIVSPPSDPYATKITNLWYSWAQYYLNQFTNAAAPQPFTGTVSIDPNSPNTDTRIITLPAGTTRSDLQVGMAVTGVTINGNSTPITSLTTILKIVPATSTTGEQIYLSAPIPAQAGQTVTVSVSNPQQLKYSSGNTPGLDENLLGSVNFGADAAFATQFAASVYELMSVYSTVPENHTLLPPDMDLVYEAIGGNVGFLPANVNVLTAITADVRDLGKSVLRGVPNFLTYADQHQTDANWKPGDWYPPPSRDMYGTGYNVYNLDPFVWFVHQRLGLSGYGFSFDDDVSDVGAGGASQLLVTFASGPTENPVTEQWFPSTAWGAVSASGTVTPYQGSIQAYQGKAVLTLPAQFTKQYWQILADDPANGLVGAYVSGKIGTTVIPAGTQVLAKLDSNALSLVLTTSAPQTAEPATNLLFTGYPPSQTLGGRRARR